jgi:hypothetical protein
MKPNKVTGANAGGPRQLPMRTRWAARVAQFSSEVIRQEKSVNLFGMGFDGILADLDQFEESGDGTASSPE